MMTGQPYKSPEAAAAPAAAEKAQTTDGTQTTTTVPVSSSAAAVRGVSTVSARLQRQRLANQLYKDAWTAIDPSLKGSITPRELLDKVAPLAGLEGNITDADLEDMMGGPSADGEAKITCKSDDVAQPSQG